MQSTDLTPFTAFDADRSLASTLFVGAGEMAERCRAFDWSSTPLGPISTWSPGLRTTVGLVLESRNPMFLWWGSELVQVFNDAYAPSLGLDGRRERALGARGQEFWTDIWETIGPQIEQVMSTGEATWHEDQYLPIQRNGHLEDVWWTYSYSPVRDDGAVAGVLVVCQETTARVMMLADRERLLGAERAAHVEADAANRAKSEFLAVMSHELRTPLNAIGGHAQLIEMGVHGPVTTDQLTALERIQRSQRHLLGLINGVLNYAKIDAGAMLYVVDEVHMDDTLSTCEALTAPQARTKQLDLRYVRCDARLTALADLEKVQQIVLNLLSNAIKFTDAGGRVTLECLAATDHSIVVRVHDTGRGIPPDQLDRVFQPFVQIDAKLTRASEGTGLGLAISRELARGMGGELVAESEVGVGSTFTLTLPPV
ncbi:MAG TPA: ATP-binding protein [Gemmatimonadaceae bacterium]|jgi:signal transduction histidine kinase|nr:ATP-binding protein [Gemmatimonadaceae bacterium]